MACFTDFEILTKEEARKLKRIGPDYNDPEFLPKLMDRALNSGLTEEEAAALIPTYEKYSSAASAGGAATEAMTFASLEATDTILAVTQKTPGANSVAIIGYGTPGAGSMNITWTADPGAGAVVEIFVLKA